MNAPKKYESLSDGKSSHPAYLWWVRFREYAGIIAVVLIFGLFGYAIYLGNRADAEEVELLKHVEKLVDQSRELSAQNQKLVDFVAQEMAAHRCRNEDDHDAILEAIFARPVPDQVDVLCR